jgi:hypothetical protein
MNRTPSNQQIEARAYEIFLERGGVDGYDVDDWIAAEKELNARHQEIEAIYAQEKPERETVQVGYAVAASGERK